MEVIVFVGPVKIVVRQVALHLDLGKRIRLKQSGVVKFIFGQHGSGSRPFEMPGTNGHTPFAIDPGDRFAIDWRSIERLVNRCELIARTPVKLLKLVNFAGVDVGQFQILPVNTQHDFNQTQDSSFGDWIARILHCH